MLHSHTGFTDFSPKVQYQKYAYFPLLSTLYTPSAREVAAKPSPRVLRAPSRRTTNKPRRRAAAPLVPLPWREFPLQQQRWRHANSRFTPDGCMQRPLLLIAQLPPIVCVADIDTCTSVSRADAISGRQIRPVTECGSACAILQARCLRA